MSEHESKSGSTPDKIEYPLDLAPDDAYILPERVIGAIAASESAQSWLDNHPEQIFAAMPPDSDEHPSHNRETDQEELDALIAEVNELAQPRTVIINRFELVTHI